MCGLAGAVKSGDLTSSEIIAFEKLLMLSHWRGEDATGVVWGNQFWEKGKRDMEYTYLKDTMPSPEFLVRHQKTFLNEYSKNPKLLMGHCRWATIGEKKRENAHPFISKNIIGMHNGTITGLFENSQKFDTDSEALLFNIGEKGLLPALEPLKYRSPAYALTWIDKRDNTLNFFRNSARPLWFAKNSDGLIMWASEKEFLDFALPREKIRADTNYTIKEHHHFMIHLDQPQCTDAVNVTWNNYEEDLKVKVYTQGYTFPVVTKETLTSDTSQEDGEDEAPDDIIWVLNNPIEKSEYLRRLKRGCSWCAWELNWATRSSATWIDDNEWLCSGCCKMTGMEEYVKEEQQKYWTRVREEHAKKHPNIPFKTQRQTKAEKKAAKKEEKRKLLSLKAEVERRKKERDNLTPAAQKFREGISEALNDKPWDDSWPDENGEVSVH